MFSVIRSSCKCLSQTLIKTNLTPRRHLPLISLAVNYSSKKESNDKPSTPGSFEAIKNTSSTIIFDVDEERQLARDNPDYVRLYQQPEELVDEFEDINLERGITGVYDVEDLVDVLNKQRAVDLCVISIPPEHRYVDFIVIVTGKSYKHMLSMATFVRRVFKKKYDPEQGDKPPRIEGEESDDWIALDLGNIALHIFSSRARAKYDLESLWCLGRELDARSNEEDDLISVLRSHSFSLDDLKAMDEPDTNIPEDKK
ncbi:hypothetical protein M8J77_015467 [Diaphorina citri]|nr:hypothetical protein M8J77_015467 [Diaphorina citri]